MRLHQLDIPVLAVALCLAAVVFVALWFAHQWRRNRRDFLSVSAEREVDQAALGISASIARAEELAGVTAAIVSEFARFTGTSVLAMCVPADGGHDAELTVWDQGSVRVSSVQGAADREVRHAVSAVGVRTPQTRRLYLDDQVVAVFAFSNQMSSRRAERLSGLLERLDGHVALALGQALVARRRRDELLRLEQVAAVREQLVANISHELRTPLTSIVGFLQTLRRSDLDLDDATRERFLVLVEQGSERLRSLVDDLLDLNRMQRGSLPLKLEPTSLAHIATQVAAELAIPDERTLVLDIQAACPVTADSARMFQVMANLVVNAVRHGSGRIDIAVRQDGNHGVVEIRDEGSGVPRAKVEELFQPFVHFGGRSDSTGLGLAIARGIVESHGGKLEYRGATSQHPHAFVIHMALASRSESRSQDDQSTRLPKLTHTAC